MITKPADYIICECGYPWWTYNNHSKLNKKQSRNSSETLIIKKPTILIEKNLKLLPLRETLTDYYTRFINKSAYGRTIAIDSTAISQQHPNSKQEKHKRNEAIKEKQQQQENQNQNQNHRNQQNISDKRRRRRSNKPGSLMRTSSDSDLDGF